MTLDAVGCVDTETVQHHALPQPRPDKALVYFYRERQLEGGGVGFG